VLRLRGSVSRKIRVPSIDQLFNASAGNPNLRPERANGVDVGADYRLAQTSTLGVSAFSTHARDFIERISPAPFQNQDRYHFRGIEVTGRTAAFPRLDLRASYSFLDSDNLRPAGARPLQTRPRHRGDFQWTWTPVGGSAVRGAVYSTGTQFYDSRGNDPVQREAGEFTVVDLGFTQTVARRYQIAFDVTNLFDHLYDQAYGLPREGRAAVLTLRIR
jgi:vitamin B12 transporter